MSNKVYQVACVITVIAGDERQALAEARDLLDVGLDVHDDPTRDCQIITAEACFVTEKEG